jgi:sigma-B regulation protein RsbU (phosphoserine phosphatase)
MAEQRSWQDQMKVILELMRDLSNLDDPQAAAVMYALRLKESGLIPDGERLSISRRNVAAPFYRVTRSSRWKENIDPWKNPQALPMMSGGLLGELLYSNDPAIIENLPERLKKDDPAYEYLCGFELLIAFPQFEKGEALNMIIALAPKAAGYPLSIAPTMLWMSNLWGRAVHNLVLRRELEKSHAELSSAHTRLVAVNEVLDKELRVVGEIQQSLLPKTLPKVPGLELAAHYRTSQRAGGDYYDAFDCGGCWGFMIADVSGHGAPAAVIMAVTHAIAHLHPGKGAPPGELLGFVNSTLARRYTVENGSFVTAFYGSYDLASRKLRYARAGHNPPRLLRDGKIMSLEGKGSPPLGITAEVTYPESSEILRSGDLLLLYTDGITEARNGEAEMFGVDRLDQAILNGPATAQETVDRVLAKLSEFTGDDPPMDDQTLLAVAVK